MEYKLDYASWGSIFAVPCAVVDRHIRLCSGLSLKVLLWLLRNPEQSADPDALAKLLGYSAEDITDAIKYWADAGILTQSDDTGNHAASRTPTQNGPAARGVAPASDKDQIQMSSTQLIGKPRYSRAEVLRIIDGDKVLGELVHAAQPILGKPLTSVDMDILVALYSYYSLSGHYILSVIQYCVSLGKNSMRYIEKTAASWVDEGIDNANVDEHIKRLTQRRTRESVMQRMIGIGDRALVPKEQRYLAHWLEELCFNEEMVSLAYERTIENIGKLSFAYMNSILESWHKKGIADCDAARKEGIARQAQPKGAHKSAAYDIDQLTRMIEAEYAAK